MARCEFTTLRLRLIEIGARVIEHAARIRVHLPTSYPQRDLFAGIARLEIIEVYQGARRAMRGAK